MVEINMIHHQQQQTTAISSIPISSPSSSTIRPPHTTTTTAAATNNNMQQKPQQQQQQIPSPISLASQRQLPSQFVTPISAAHPTGEPAVIMSSSSPVARVRFSDLVPYDGVATDGYLRAVESLSGSLTRHNAVVIELGVEDGALMRCGLESARMYFRTRAQSGGCWSGSNGNNGFYKYRAGRALEDMDSSPPCMADVFRCMGKAARAALNAIARHLRLRSDAFNHLLDDNPLPANEASSSVLVASHLHMPLQKGKGAIGGGNITTNNESEKGLLTLISSDAPGLQVRDPNGRWYLADYSSAPGDLLLLTGKALSHATAGLRPAASYRAATDCTSTTSNAGRSSLAFRLMPQSNAILDCSPIRTAGHVIPQSYVPISVSQFMDDLSADEDVPCNGSDSAFTGWKISNKEPSLRSVLSDSLSGTFLEDAMFAPCGHSFGGMMLKRVIEAGRCTVCDAEVGNASLIPNHALRAAAAAVKREDDRRLFHNAAMRKQRREVGDRWVNGDATSENGSQRCVQYPFSVNEKVVIKGNRRTPDKFVGKEAIITSQSLNGWYLVNIIESGEKVRLQYRSFTKIPNSPPQPQPPPPATTS
ncbi:putative Zinc finger, RING/FYVE/PHD-type, isopenicillin N synthase [Helianthus annuus]|nr:putative Zinc finger, RING/FYVE/PHD-type, isopenicillin N synthase [Helianthus annuus]